MTETTEKIVESYFRFCRNCATMTNIRCSGQHEIDLLAVDLKTGTRYHVESSVHVGAGFSQLTSRPFAPELLHDRNKGPDMRRTLGFFEEIKFSAEDVVKKLAEYGFAPGTYHKVIVTWDCDADVTNAAAQKEIEVLEFPALVDEFTKALGDRRSYMMDDTIRMLQLFTMAQKAREKE
jgi:hypothetical protein